MMAPSAPTPKTTPVPLLFTVVAATPPSDATLQLEPTLQVAATRHRRRCAARRSTCFQTLEGGAQQAHAIDCSWTPDTDSDLAGYVVYRRDVTAGTTMERVSPRTPLVAPSFTDAAVVPGHRYAWVVSAIDQDGNESARSPEAEEELPQ